MSAANLDVNYIVDSATELGELTPLECAALYLLDPAYRAVDQLIADNVALPDDFLQNTARLALNRASLPVQHWVTLNSLPSVAPVSQFILERAEYLLQKKIQSDLGVAAGGQLIHGMAENLDQFFGDVLVSSEADVTETSVRAILARHMGSLLARLDDDSNRISDALAWYHADGGEAFRALQTGHNRTCQQKMSLASNAYALSMTARKERLRIENKRPVRGAIKKVYKLFAQFGQTENLRLFVSGSEVELSHPSSKFKFILRPLGEAGWLEERSAKGQAHTPYDLTLLTKEDVFVSKLCVYINDTPVLDQLLALALFVQAGDELRILEKANFFSFAEATREASRELLTTAYPSLGSKFPKTRAGDDEFGAVAVAGQTHKVINLGAPFRAEEVHWEPFRGRMTAWVGTWFEPVFTELLPKAELFRIAP